MRKSLRTSLFIILATITTQVIAQNKVVVIPLGGDGVTAPNKESSINNNTYNNASRAYEIAESKEITGSISTPGDVDYYEIYLPFCEQLTAEIQAGGGDSCGAFGASQPYIDTYLTAFNKDGTTTLDTNDDIDNPANYCSRVQAVSGSGEGFYFIRVEASPSFCPTCTFNYKLVISREPWLC